MSSGFSSSSSNGRIILVIFQRTLWKGAGFIPCFYWAKKRVKHCCWSVLIFVYRIQMIERGRFYVCLLVGWHHWEAISQALSPKTSNGNVASHCTHSFVTATCSLLCFWLFLSTINQILVLFGEHLDTKWWCYNSDWHCHNARNAFGGVIISLWSSQLKRCHLSWFYQHHIKRVSGDKYHCSWRSEQTLKAKWSSAWAGATTHQVI